MRRIKSVRRRKGFTIIEVLVVALIVEILTAVALPAYISEVYAARQGVANQNAKTLALAVQGKALTASSYDTVLTDYSVDMGGAIPINPCTGTTSGYTITLSGSQCIIAATAGTSCGTWSPTNYIVGYSSG